MVEAKEQEVETTNEVECCESLNVSEQRVLLEEATSGQKTAKRLE